MEDCELNKDSTLTVPLFHKGERIIKVRGFRRKRPEKDKPPERVEHKVPLMVGLPGESSTSERAELRVAKLP